MKEEIKMKMEKHQFVKKKKKKLIFSATICAISDQK